MVLKDRVFDPAKQKQAEEEQERKELLRLEKMDGEKEPPKKKGWPWIASSAVVVVLLLLGLFVWPGWAKGKPFARQTVPVQVNQTNTGQPQQQPAAAPVSAPAFEQPVSLPRAQTPEPIEEMFLPGLKLSILGEGKAKPPANIESWKGDWKTTLQNGTEVFFEKTTVRKNDMEAWVENNQLFIRLTDEANKTAGMTSILLVWEVVLIDGTKKNGSLDIFLAGNPNVKSSMGYRVDLTSWAEVAKRIDFSLR